MIKTNARNNWCDRSKAGDDRATLFTTVTNGFFRSIGNRFKVVVLHPGAVETFRAKTVSQIFRRDGQIAALAAHLALAFGQ